MTNNTEQNPLSIFISTTINAAIELLNKKENIKSEFDPNLFKESIAAYFKQQYNLTKDASTKAATAYIDSDNGGNILKMLEISLRTYAIENDLAKPAPATPKDKIRKSILDAEQSSTKSCEMLKNLMADAAKEKSTNTSSQATTVRKVSPQKLESDKPKKSSAPSTESYTFEDENISGNAKFYHDESDDFVTNMMSLTAETKPQNRSDFISAFLKSYFKMMDL